MPLGREVVVIDTGVTLALMVKLFGAVESIWCIGAVESVTVKVCDVTPLLPDNGVPLMTPDEGLRLKPLGNAGFTDQVYGNAPPVAVSCVLGYGWFTVPAGSVNELIVGGAGGLMVIVKFC